jgi:hypothetical protein
MVTGGQTGCPATTSIFDPRTGSSETRKGLICLTLRLLKEQRTRLPRSYGVASYMRAEMDAAGPLPSQTRRMNSSTSPPSDLGICPGKHRSPWAPLEHSQTSGVGIMNPRVPFVVSPWSLNSPQVTLGVFCSQARLRGRKSA